ncbi:AAA family ATPase [Tenacibaculum maritimum]|uniref:AAA family ATPase n=1 Tax=Tenacibaculum maritimum TaxID=107401 RepID=UPI001E54C42E|nr:AAA family ATPase [Tenacibaculum maritimum]MCD9584764.1 AAA family ATPase [Tenacibaculum maritimum]MCD9621622.1 AAA family ATPase [Tenacibaculum maritimum]MCD9626811.1 AAA family ATPase [Tenacibaculum maritimum]MCD9630491.1 AAA family ATPase [Tenacibaculum maritimum]MCD9633759.1 AAA family ATPase [Tenacibaculum maritimum]
MKDKKKNSPFGEIITPSEKDFELIVSEENLISREELFNTGFGDVVIPSEDEIRESNKFINKVTSEPYKKGNNFSKDDFSGLKLFEMNHKELPTLLAPIFPKVGLASLIGSSDTGKSTFLRQLALSIALGLDNFVGYKINSNTRNVIFISTEDDPVSTSFSIKKPLHKILSENHQLNKSLLNHFKFIFDVDLSEKSERNLIKILNKDLSEVGADLIIVDAFTDIFSGDINSSTKVREFLNLFSKIAKKHNCLILFLHHTGKKTDKYAASKNNALGSQAFEAKMRVLLELKHHPNNEYQRTLSITKGNYISTETKKYCKVLDFDEKNLLFSDSGKKIPVDKLYSLGKTNPQKEKILPIIKKLHQEGLSARKMEDKLRKDGFKIGKSTINNYINELKL